eukprot:760267-Hanusia_phi.AAC.12
MRHNTAPRASDEVQKDLHGPSGKGKQRNERQGEGKQRSKGTAGSARSPGGASRQALSCPA